MENHTILAKELGTKLHHLAETSVIPQADYLYLKALATVLDSGYEVPTRANKSIVRYHGLASTYSLRNRFPLLICKKLHWESIRSELAWMLDGHTNVSYLQARRVKIWDAWADADGEVIGVYGTQWRDWKTSKGETVDQIAQLAQGLKDEPHSRRHVLCGWNAGEIAQNRVALPACHAMAQWHMTDSGLSCSLYQRSADMFLGVPFNIASYALLTHLLARYLQVNVNAFHHHIGDAHVYSDHLEAIQQLIQNLEKNTKPRKGPKLLIGSWDPFSRHNLSGPVDSWQTSYYSPLPAIKAPITV